MSYKQIPKILYGIGMSQRSERPSRYSYAKPPKVYRPTEKQGPVTPVRMLMAELIREEIVRKKLHYYKLDTLLIRETRAVAYLGQAAIEKYAEALQKLAPETWDQPMTVPVRDMATDIRKGVGGRRIVLQLDHPDALIEERERALAITRRMTGVEIPHFTSRLDITVGKLNPVIDNTGLQSRLEEAVPQQITLLPTVIETEPLRMPR